LAPTEQCRSVEGDPSVSGQIEIRDPRSGQALAGQRSEVGGNEQPGGRLAVVDCRFQPSADGGCFGRGRVLFGLDDDDGLTAIWCA
jgi:hypothetical protein